jgi:hypothetical protein
VPSRKARQQASASAPPVEGSSACFLCDRPIGQRIEWHHSVPKSRGGRETVPVHPICHRAIHAALSNKDLERDYASGDALRGHPELARFVAWVACKDPDFHAPTRRRKP